ncbi:MAG: type ISP restriction/modification enzyme [Pyrinomonadaceae bacterium]
MERNNQCVKPAIAGDRINADRAMEMFRVRCFGLSPSTTALMIWVSPSTGLHPWLYADTRYAGKDIHPLRGGNNMAKIYYHATGADWRKEQKYRFLDESGSVYGVEWTEITPDAKHNWLTAGMRDEFETFISIGNKEAKASKNSAAEAVFVNYSRGVATARDDWAYNFSQLNLTKNIEKSIKAYEEHRERWLGKANQDRIKNLLDKKPPIDHIVDEFITRDDSVISWSRDLKLDLRRNKTLKFVKSNIRSSVYRPFTKQHLYFDRVLNEEVYVFPSFFPTGESELENRVICTTTEAQIPFSSQISNLIPCLHYGGRQTQCFPFYTYNEDGTNRRENITDWALEQFREHYGAESRPVGSVSLSDARSEAEENTLATAQVSASGPTAPDITKWDIFYYTYAILHHPDYRERYAANLKRELPRIPFAPDFWAFSKAGKELADIHVNYEDQLEYKLDMIESGKLALDWRVERMKYNQDKTAIIYNEFLTIGGIPPEVHEYRLGNRSALDWIVDQYKVSIDKRSGITNDPNRDDDPQYIVSLIKKIVTVSLRTNEIVRTLPTIIAK